MKFPKKFPFSKFPAMETFGRIAGKVSMQRKLVTRSKPPFSTKGFHPETRKLSTLEIGNFWG